MVQYRSGNVRRSGAKRFSVDGGQAFGVQLVCGNPTVGVTDGEHDILQDGGRELVGFGFEKCLVTSFAQEFVGGQQGSAFIPVCKGMVHDYPICQLCGEPRGTLARLVMGQPSGSRYRSPSSTGLTRAYPPPMARPLRRLMDSLVIRERDIAG